MLLQCHDVVPGPPAPHDVTLQKIRSDSMVVSWQPPSPTHGVITAYEISHSPVTGESHPVLITVSDQTLQHRIAHLQINKSYKVQVRTLLSLVPIYVTMSQDTSIRGVVLMVFLLFRTLANLNTLSKQMSILWIEQQSTCN